MKYRVGILLGILNTAGVSGPLAERIIETLENELEHDAELRAAGIPGALEKALGDPFTYAMGLRNGQVIVFEQARLSDDLKWVHLTPSSGISVVDLQGEELTGKYPLRDLAMTFDRGLDVRISDIVWVADAPWGS